MFSLRHTIYDSVLLNFLRVNFSRSKSFNLKLLETRSQQFLRFRVNFIDVFTSFPILLNFLRSNFSRFQNYLI